MTYSVISKLSLFCLAAFLAGCAAEKPQQNLALDLNSPQVKKQVKIAAAASPLAVIASASPSYRVAQLDDNAPLPIFKERSLNELAYADSGKSPANNAFEAYGLNTTPVVLERSTPEVEELIRKYALAYNVPESLVRRVVKRESNGNPNVRNGPYWGLMQISHPTAKKMGYDGYPDGLLDAETNLRYAVKYLAGAYLVAGGNEASAVKYYARGYYFDAKSKHLLEETGLKSSPTAPATAYQTASLVAKPQSVPSQTINDLKTSSARNTKNNLEIAPNPSHEAPEPLQGLKENWSAGQSETYLYSNKSVQPADFKVQYGDKKFKNIDFSTVNPVVPVAKPVE